MIQLRNQLAYSVFHIGRVNDVVVGEDEVLYQSPAINSFLGRDFVGEKEINRNVRHFRSLQDTLAAHGTLLVFVIAPGKAGIYPEKQPLYFRNQARQRSNYTAYAEKLAAAGVNLIDFGAVFRHWKDTSAYPLFPRGGIHWSIWGRTLAADSLLRYLRERGHLAIPDDRITSRELSKIPRDSDNDIAKALNLFKEPEAYLMAYPNLEFLPAPPSQRKPNMLLVGDSFGEGLLPYLVPVFSQDSRFWYYNRQVSWVGIGTPAEGEEVEPLDKKQQTNGRDVVLVVYSEPNLSGFDRGFTDDLFLRYNPYTEAENSKIKDIEAQMKADTATANRIWRQSYTQGIDPKFIFYREARAAFDKSR